MRRYEITFAALILVIWAALAFGSDYIVAKRWEEAVYMNK